MLIRLHALELLEVSHDIPIVIDEVAALTPKHRKIIQQRKRAYFDLVRDTLEALKAKRRLREVDTTVATFSLFGVLLWLPSWYKNSGRLSGERVIENLLCIVRRGPQKHVLSTRSKVGQAQPARLPCGTSFSCPGRPRSPAPGPLSCRPSDAAAAGEVFS